MSITKICRISGKEFTITDQEIALLDKLSLVIGGEKFSIPLPTLCPEERMRRRAQFKNYFYLHKRKCDLTGKDMISTFSKDSDSTVWNLADWWNSAKDGILYEREIDWEKNFNEQCAEFMRKVPQFSLDNEYSSLENSEFINGNGKSKNCYLISNGHNNENCLYGFYTFNNTSILDSNYVRFSENCSFSSHYWRSYNIHYAFDVEDCRDSRYVFSVYGGQYLLGCVNRNNAKYEILNIPCTPGEYEEVLEKLKYDELYVRDFEKKVLKLIEKEGIVNSITTGSMDSKGDFLYDSKSTQYSYNSSEIQDSFYIRDAFEVRDSMDINAWGDNTSLTYDCIAVGENISNYYWSQGSYSGGTYNFYTQNCIGCSYVFGCSGLENKSYCILNKQYTKEDWESNVKKLIRKMQMTGEWGEFWDPKYAWYPYDASYAMTLFPLTKDEVLSRGLKWSDYEMKTDSISRTIPGEKLPFDIREVPDDILNWAILCKKTGKPYKIQKLELELHRKFSIPIPRLHPNERMQKFFVWDKREFSFDF